MSTQTVQQPPTTTTQPNPINPQLVNSQLPTTNPTQTNPPKETPKQGVKPAEEVKPDILLRQSYVDNLLARRGEGQDAVSDRLNAGPKIQKERPVVEKIIEKVIWRDEPARTQTQVVTKQVVDDRINREARNILAETMAKVALL